MCVAEVAGGVDPRAEGARSPSVAEGILTGRIPLKVEGVRRAA